MIVVLGEVGVVVVAVVVAIAVAIVVAVGYMHGFEVAEWDNARCGGS